MLRSSPHDLLPLQEPCKQEFKTEPTFFYENVAKPLIADTIRIMNNGLPIDLNKVEKLEKVLEEILTKVQLTIDNNRYIKEYLDFKYPSVKAQLEEEIKSKFREPLYYKKDFDSKNPVHRSYYMLEFSKDKFDIISPLEEVMDDVPKWSAKDVKRYVERYPTLGNLLKHTVRPTDAFAVRAMKHLAKDRADLWNKSYKEQIAQITFASIMEQFNPASAPQKQSFFDWLGIEPIAFSKDTNLPSWGRKVIEEIMGTETDEELRELYQAFIDHSFAAIVKQNFIESFYQYTIDGRLYGNYRLLGAKSGRYTSNNPNMLNSPSTGSIYAKPIKECFVAPKGYLVWGIDYAALEDRVIASLTRDPNKCGLFLQNLDGHSLGAVSYFPGKVATEMELTGDIPTDAIRFKQLVDDGNGVLKKLRQDGKAVTFGLSYGCYPPKVAKTLKIPINEAEEIFNNYHNKLYSKITEYREDYVLATAKAENRIHLGMGFYINSNNPRKDIRTLANATCQFWSILTALAINKLHTLIDEFLIDTSDIQITSTIYDSIYGIVYDDPEVIAWLNTMIVNIMEKDFMLNQTVKNEAQLEIGLSWAKLYPLPKNATEEEIQSIIKEKIYVTESK